MKLKQKNLKRDGNIFFSYKKYRRLGRIECTHTHTQAHGEIHEQTCGKSIVWWMRS